MNNPYSQLLTVNNPVTTTGQGDSTPPVVESVTLSTPTGNTNTDVGPVVIPFSVHVTDDLSGVGNLNLSCPTDSKINAATAYGSVSSPSSGTRLDGVWTGTMTISQYTPSGTYSQCVASGWDRVNNPYSQLLTVNNPVTTIAGTAPENPSVTSVTPGNGSATVTWSQPSNDGGMPITGYTVTASPGGSRARRVVRMLCRAR